jgi:hypothetical protein
MPEQPKLKGALKIALGQMIDDVTVTFSFEVSEDANTIFDWLASQHLDGDSIVIALKTSNMRVVS